MRDRPFFLLNCALLGAILVNPCQAQWYRADAAIMGTPVHVELWSAQATQANDLIEQVFAEMRRIDALMSPFKPDSELSRLNRQAARQPMLVGKELYTLIDQALQMSVLTQGAFDISFSSVGQFYDYRAGVKPAAKTIANYLPAIDFQSIKLQKQNHSIFYLHPKLNIDLGGIAKGYAVDRAIAILQNKGIEHALVSAGGDSRILGDKRGRPWMVGIQDPRDKRKLAANLPVRDVSISTSGDYERFFIDDNVRYHHILDPNTGASAAKVRSVTVLGKSCQTTDALSTGIFVLGVKLGLRLIESRPDNEVVIVDNKGRLYFSKGLLRKR